MVLWRGALGCDFSNMLAVIQQSGGKKRGRTRVSCKYSKVILEWAAPKAEKEDFCNNPSQDNVSKQELDP